MITEILQVSGLTTRLLSVGTGGGAPAWDGSYLQNYVALTNGGEVLHPVGYGIGDLLLFFFGGRAGGGVTFLDYTPTLADGRSAFGQCEGFAYYRTAADVVASETVTYGYSRAKGWIVLSMPGAAFDSALDDQVNNLSTHTCPDLTTLTDGCRIFRMMAGNSGFGSITGRPAGTLVDEQTFSEGAISLVDEGIQATAGPTGTAAFTTSGNGFSIPITLAVKEAP